MSQRRPFTPTLRRQEEKEEPTFQKKYCPRYKQSVQTQVPRQRIVLYDSNLQKHIFPIVNDADVGINKFQRCIIDMRHDDDQQTTSTQMERGVRQTMNDLLERLNKPMSSQKSSEN